MHAAVPRIRKPVAMAAALALGALAIMVILTHAPGPSAAKASSHSEAPLISQDPRADNTDLYAFVSPDDTNTVTIIANYIPLEAPASGPNFYSFDDSALYQIGIDQNGDGRRRHRLPVPLPRRRRGTRTRSSTTPGRSPRSTDANWNRPQTYTLTRVRLNKNGNAKDAGRPRQQHPDAARQHRAALDAELRRPRVGGGHEPARRDQGVRRPAGRPVLRRPRLGLRPGRAASVQPVPPDPAAGGAGRGRVAELQHALDRSCACRSRSSCRLPKHDGRHLCERRAASRRPSSSADGTKDGHGPWVQVSRLGNPLINEVVIPLGRQGRTGTGTIRLTTASSPTTTRLPRSPTSRTCSTALHLPVMQAAPWRRSPRRAQRSLADPAHGRARAELHGLDAVRSAQAEHGDQARRERRLSRRHGQPGRARPDGRPRRRPLRLPERAAAGRRRCRHRVAGDRARATARSSTGRSVCRT